MLALKLLGALSLQSDAGSVPPAAQQKRRVGLLALLAVAGERGVSRDRLQAYLWPESPSSRSRHALDQLVYSVRRSLGVDPIISEGRDLRLDPSILTSDLRSFTVAIDEGRLEDAVAVYGGPLLEGFYLSDSRELETWIDTERMRLAQEHQSALETLARDSSAKGDTAASLAWWRKLAAADPLSSRIAVEVIRALIDAGETPSAIHHARSYQQLVRDELEIEPDPRIEEIIGSLGRANASARNREIPGPQSDPPIPPAQVSAPRRALLPWRLAAIGLLVVALVGSLALFQRARARTVTNDAPSARKAVSPAAQEQYLRGVNAWNDRSKRGMDTAVVYFRRAIELEPFYAEAYAGLANAYVLLGYSGYRPAKAMFPKAKAAARRAIDLDDALAPPYAALGLELTWERQFGAAEAAFRKSISLDPRYATAHQWYGMLLMILGRVDEAVLETGRAAALDPLSLQVQNTYATFLAASGDEVGALRQYERMVGEEPDSAWVRRNPWLLTNMSAVYAANGMWDKALKAAEQSVEAAPGHPRSLDALASVYASMGKPEIAKRVFASADTTNEHYPAQRALFLLDLGERDSAFAQFDRVHEWPIPTLISLGGKTSL